MGILLLVVITPVITNVMTKETNSSNVSNLPGAPNKFMEQDEKPIFFYEGTEVVEYLVKTVQLLKWNEMVVVSDQNEMLDLFLEQTQEHYHTKLNIYSRIQALFKDVISKSLTSQHFLLFGSKDLQKAALDLVQQIPDLVGPFSSIVLEAFWLCLLDFDLLETIDVRQLQINNFAVFVPSTDTTVRMLKTLLWTPGGRQFSSVIADISTATTNNLYPNVNYGLNGAVLKVGTKEWSPLVKNFTRQGSNTYIGYCIDLLDIFSEKLNFSYELVLPVDNDWGDIKNDQWTGIMGLFERKEIDMAIGPLSPSEQRANITDWTSSFHPTSEGVFFRQEDTQDYGWIAYLSPFSWEVYVYTLGTFVFYIVIFVIVHRSYKWLKGFSTDLPIFEIAEFLFGSLFNQAMSTSWTFRLARFLVACWCLMVLVLTSSFTSKLTSLLVSGPAPLPFTSLDELATRDDYRWGIIGGSLTSFQFRTSKNITFQTLYKKLTAFAEEDPDVLSPYQDVHLQKVLAGHYAFVGDQSIMGNEETLTKGNIKFLQLYVAGMSSFHVFVPKNSTLKQKIGNIIMNLDEAGVLMYLRNRWWKSESISQGKRAASPSSVTMTTVQGPLYLAIGGLILAGVIILFERKLSATRRTVL